jgi:hypothetical protein
MSTRPSVRSENRQVRAIVTDIHRDLTGRAGCRWDGIEYYIQQEILDAWVKIVERVLSAPAPEEP